MNTFSKNVLSVFLLNLIIGFLLTEPDHSGNTQFGGTHAGLGMYLLFSATFFIGIGFILVLPKTSRNSGTVFLAVAGITYIVGFGVCTIP